MTTLSQVVHLPVFFRIGRDLPKQIPQMLHSAGVSSASILMLTGRSFSRRVADEIASQLPISMQVKIWEVQSSSEAEVQAVAVAAREAGCDLLMSVGGGSVVDVGKRVQRLFGIPNFVFPTIISNDGLISPISVLENAEGRRDSLPASVPVGVAVDLDVIRKSPRRYIVAAAGDVLSNISASSDWMRLFRESEGEMPFNDLAYELAMGAAESLIGAHHVDFEDDLFLTNVIRGQIYSGLAMSLAGTSRPCSGAEHLLSHAIDHLDLASQELHGIQVGSISLFVMSLLSGSGGAALEFARRIGLPLDWRTLSPELQTSVQEVVTTARKMRPERRTILDSLTDDEVLAECDAFSRMFSRSR